MNTRLCLEITEVKKRQFSKSDNLYKQADGKPVWEVKARGLHRGLPASLSLFVRNPEQINISQKLSISLVNKGD